MHRAGGGPRTGRPHAIEVIIHEFNHSVMRHDANHPVRRSLLKPGGLRIGFARIIMGVGMGGKKTYDISPPHKGDQDYVHVDINVHDENGNVVEKMTHAYAVFDGDSKTVNYYDAETGEYLGSSSWDDTILHTSDSKKSSGQE